MTTVLVLLLLGAVLILAGALAGRTRVGVSLGHVGRTPRLAAAWTGLLCVVTALILVGSDDYGDRAGPVRVTIRAELAPEEVSEEIRVFLGGRDVGVVRVDEQSPEARLMVRVAKAGRYMYRLASKRQVKGKKPTKVINTGEVGIGAKSVLGIYYSPKGVVFLLRER